MSLKHCCIAEFLATFALVFVGCGAIVSLDGSAHAVLSIGLCFGLVVMVMIYAVGEVSGAHLNPAVTLAFALARRFAWSWVGPYVLSQCAGALAAATLVRLLIGDAAHVGTTLPAAWAGGLPAWLRAGLLEVLFSWLLMFVILGVCTGAKEKGLMAGIAIGGTVALLATFGGPLTGASMNPARSLGPAVVSGELAAVWVYLVFPCIGTALAALSLCLIRPGECCVMGQGDPSCEPESGCC